MKIYNSISEFFSSINLPLAQEFDFTIHPLDQLHGPAPMASPKFRTNYFAFLLIAAGKGHYTIDDHWFPLKPNSFYFTTPGHLKSFSIEENWKGFMLTFSLEFLGANYPGNVDHDFPFLFTESVPVMYLTDPMFTRLEHQFEQMAIEYQHHSAFKRKILANQLATLLYQTKELLISHRAPISTENRPAEIVTEFHALLKKNFLGILQATDVHIWNIQDYAERLHLHPNYLSSVMKSETGKTIKEWIDERTITEAKSMLINTNKSVAEIAFDLTFRDASNFSRFFKKMTQTTPAKFRKVRN